jgi:uncharacterized protein
MDIIMGGLTMWAFLLTVGITLAAGFVKGAIGFAMPLIMISSFSSYMPPELALAALIVPAVVTNSSQALRQSWRAAWESIRAYRITIGLLVVFIVISAQFVVILPRSAMLLLLGVPVTVYALLVLSGRDLRVKVRSRARAEAVCGVVAGLYGGVSGVWGPPTIILLLSLNEDKQNMVRVQGVVYLIGGVVLTLAHLQSGILNATTLPLSASLIVPAMAGLWLGYLLQDRLDQARFRTWTLLLLAVTGLNLVRQGVGL